MEGIPARVVFLNSPIKVLLYNPNGTSKVVGVSMVNMLFMGEGVR